MKFMRKQALLFFSFFLEKDLTDLQVTTIIYVTFRNP